MYVDYNITAPDITSCNCLQYLQACLYLHRLLPQLCRR